MSNENKFESEEDRKRKQEYVLAADTAIAKIKEIKKQVRQKK